MFISLKLFLMIFTSLLTGVKLTPGGMGSPLGRVGVGSSAGVVTGVATGVVKTGTAGVVVADLDLFWFCTLAIVFFDPEFISFVEKVFIQV